MSTAERRRPPVEQIVLGKRETILPKKNRKQPAIPWHSWVLLAVVIGAILVTFYFTYGIVLTPWVRWSVTIVWVLANVGLAIYDFVLPSKPKDSAPTDSLPVDRWTLAHTGSGIVLGIWYVPLWAVLVLTIAWEIFETRVVGFGDKEIIKNRIMDVGVAIVGWLLIVITVMGTRLPEAPFPLLTAPRP